MAEQEVTATAQETTEAAKGAETATEQQATDTTTATEQQAAEKTAQDPVKPVAPEKYELKLPEGSLLDPSTLEKISAYAKEKGLSNEAAQEVLERENQAVASHHEAQMKKVETIRNDWAKDAEADPEIGGDDFKKNAELSRRLIEKANPAIKSLLDNTGFGNHPEVIRLMVNIIKMTGLAEDTLIHAKAQAGDTDDIAAKMYPSMAQKQ